MPTPNADAALRHLNKLKPNEGWSIDTYVKKPGVELTMLRRRNVPLHDTYFEDILLDSDTGIIIGKIPNENKAVVLIERDGSLCRERRKISLKPGGRSAADGVNRGLEQQRRERERTRQTMNESVRARTRGAEQQRNVVEELTDGQNGELLKWGAYVIGAAIAIRIFAELAVASIFGLSLLLLPVAVYASLTVPTVNSFDAKKELKRVLRGEHLSEDNPEKPKGWFQKAAAKISASVMTEIAASAGYEVTITDLVGLALFAKVTLHSNNLECFWIGAFDKWWYVYQRETNRP